jgi:hypothetical protein
MTSPLAEYHAGTYDLTIQKLQQQASERKTWLQQRLIKTDIQPSKK